MFFRDTCGPPYGHSWRIKAELGSDVYGHLNMEEDPWKTATQLYIDQLVDDSGYHFDDLPAAMSDRDGWREEVKGIRAGYLI